MAASQNPKSRSRANFYPPWAPRFWNGMILPEYFQLLRENGFKIHPARYPMTMLVGLCSILNWGLAGIQHLALGRKIENTVIEHPPIFVLGHWRSGTTLLHELLALDPQHAFPTNFDTFISRHSLISRPFMYPLVWLLMPGRRPMDNMRMGASSPQEDDMAMISLGAPTPYRRMAFPNQKNRQHEQLDPANLTPEQKQRFGRAIRYFFRVLTIQYRKRLVLKSPPHTGRIQMLAEWFPGAKFIHIARDPVRMVPSTMHLWRSLDEVQGFQLPHYEDDWLAGYVGECKDAMYNSYFRDRSHIEPDNLIEIQFEQLLAQPTELIERIYNQFNLPNFDSLRPRIEEYFQTKKDHRANRLEVTPEQEAKICRDWQDYRNQFGYENQTTTVATPKSN